MQRPSRLLGRSQELAHVGTLLQDARGGQSAALMVSGDAGIGKSALIEEVARDAADMPDTTVLRARGIEAESSIPLAGLADLLRPVQQQLDTLPEPQAAALAGALALGPPTAQDRYAIAAATLNLLAAAARGGPLLCLVDDAHWLDPSSAEALVFAARRMRAEASVIVFSVRDSEPGAARFTGIPELRLTGLDEESAMAVLTRSAGRELPAPVARRLLEDTAGNPLALMEIPGQLTEDQLSGRAPIQRPLPVGSLLRNGFLRQVHELPENTRSALLIAATSDLEAIDLIAQALQDSGRSHTDLEPAEAADLIVLDDGRLSFRHPIIRSAVYYAATPPHRRAAHRLLAGALERVAAPQADERRAWHLAAATVTADEAVAAKLEQVGLDAGRRHSHTGATRALERAALLSPSPRVRARRLLAAADAAVPAGYIQEAIRLLDEAAGWTDDPAVAAVAECERHRLGVWGDEAEANRARLMDFAGRIERELPEVAVRAYLAVAQASLFSYDIAAITHSVEHAMRLGGSDEEVALRCDVLAALGAAQSGDAGRAGELLGRRHDQLAVHTTFDIDQIVTMGGVCHLTLEHTTEARMLLERVVANSRAANAAGLLAVQLPWMASLEWLDGDWTSALAVAHEAVLLAPETGWRAQLPNSLSTLARIEAGFGMEDSCREHAAAAMQAAASGGQVATGVFALAALGLLELGLGQYDAAADTLRQAVDRAGPDPAPLLLVQVLADLVEARIRAGLLDEIETDLARLDTLARRTARRSSLSAVARCRGLLDRDDPASWFDLALKEAGSARFERARTHLAYGRMLRRNNNRAGARVQLQQALELFEGLGAAPWAKQARRELLSSGGSAPDTSGDPIELTLTPQELQVALAVRDGLTNANAAAKLFVSKKTVEYHLSNIYRKLGIRSRTQLVGLMGAARHRPR